MYTKVPHQLGVYVLSMFDKSNRFVTSHEIATWNTIQAFCDINQILRYYQDYGKQTN